MPITNAKAWMYVSWLQTRRSSEVETLRPLFDKYVEKLLQFTRWSVVLPACQPALQKKQCAH